MFQEGHLSWLVGDFMVTGTTDTLLPALVFCVAFGVSMDCEMFLLSRIVEEHHRAGDTTSAVTTGLEQTGRVPAIMKMAGRVNWWCPGPLRGVHTRFAVAEGSKAVT